MSKIEYTPSRRLVLTTALLTASISLSICASSIAKTKISFMCWTTMQADTDCFKKLVKEFTKEHPDIEVKLMAEGWTGELPYFTKYLAMTAAGIAPDVINVTYGYVPNFAEANLLEELNPWVKKGGFKLSDYTPAGIEAASWRGKLWGLNAGTGGDFWIFYNKQIMAESGVVDPGRLAAKNDWNWDTMDTIMSKTSKFDGNKLVRIGYNQMGDTSAISPWLYGMGGSVMNADGTDCTLDEPEAIAAVQRIWDGINKKKNFGLSWYPPYNLDHLNSAKKQQYAMLGWWNTIGTFLTSQKVSWPIDMVPFPAGPKEARNNVASIHSVCISKQSKQKAASWELVKFLSGRKGQMIYAEDLQGLPTRKDLVRRFGEIYKERGFSGGDLFIDDAMARLRPMDRSSKYDKALPKIMEGLSKIWSGKADVTQTLQATAKNANVDLIRAKKK